ncbi:hypothetical protein [Horticoccus sp. 23ND18S-11]
MIALIAPMIAQAHSNLVAAAMATESVADAGYDAGSDLQVAAE